MATSDVPAPAPSEQVTATPQAAASDAIAPADERIPLAPMPQRPVAAPAKFLARLRVIDGLLVLLVLVFAFEVACFRALNTDVFLHLAAGRAVATGAFLAGSDLFTYGAVRAWVNHSWLPDVIAYALYQSLGHDTAGIVFVVLKALLVAALAWVMMRAGSLPGRSLWIPALCTLLGVLTFSPRLLLQSTVLSFFLLGLTVLLLERVRAGKVSPWVLPVVCLGWVNLDGWFLLGPITIGLYVLGELLQRVAGEGEDTVPTSVTPARLGVVLAASVAACLVNPFHVGAFTLPPSLDFSEASTVLGTRWPFRGMYLAPWENDYFDPRLGLSAAGLSYFVLLAVGLVSFGLTAPRWRWWRVLVWLAFAALSLFSMRAIPFFAVVAGPITALNLLDGLARFYGTDIRNDLNTRQMAVVGRVGAVLAALILILVGIPGWLQAEPRESRQFGVGLKLDEGLRDAALAVKSWREQGALPEATRFFNTSPEVVNYFAWFCPQERTFFDFRLPLFDATAARDFLDATRSLQGEDAPEERTPAWRRVFARHEAQFLVFSSSNLIGQASTLRRVQSNPNEFVPCYVNGATAIWAWRDPAAGARAFKPDPRLARDFDREAFGPEARPAPEQRPTLPGPAPWYRDLLPAPSHSTLERDTAFQHEMRFEGLEMRYAMNNQLQVQAQMAAPLIGQAGMPGGPLLNGLLYPLRINHTFTGRTREQMQPMDVVAENILRRFISTQDSGPPAALYLGIRAARRSLEQNPEDAEAYLILARCYTKLGSRTRERPMSFELVNHVELIRQSQTTAALRNVLKYATRPEQARSAHLLLADAYRNAQLAEARVRHFREYLTLTRKIGPPAKGTKEFKEGVDQQEKSLAEMEQRLKRVRDQYEVQSANKPLLEKVRLALRAGLGETALALLEKVEDIKELVNPNNPRETAGGQIAIDLMLLLGELEKARLVLSGDPTSDKSIDRRAFGAHPLGIGAYQWFQVQLAAASGDYATADKVLGELIAEGRKNENAWQVLEGMEIVEPAYGVGKDATMGTFAGLLVGHVLLDQATRATGPLWQARHLMPYNPTNRLPRRPGWQVPLAQGVNYVTTLIQQEAELCTVRAWLSLEAGQIEKAREQAKEAVRLSDLGPGPNNTRQYLGCSAMAQLVLELAEGNKRHSR